MRRSTSRWIKPTPTKIAIATEKNRIDAIAMSCRMRLRSTYEMLARIRLAKISTSAKKKSV